MSGERPQFPLAARAIRRASPLVILAWVALTLLVTFAVPSLEDVGDAHSVSLAPQDAPGGAGHEADGQGFPRIRFGQFRDDRAGGPAGPWGRLLAVIMPTLVRELLRGDSRNTSSMSQDLWGDRLTATGAQSPDR